MKKGNGAVTWPVLIALLVAAGFATDRYLTMRTAAEASTSAIADLERAGGLLDQTRAQLTTDRGNEGVARLKQLIREGGGRNGIQPSFISEGEGDAGAGFREKIITFRYTEVPHANLVNLLALVEREGGGATFKELRLTPSERMPERYRNAECVLTWRCLDEQSGPGGGTP